MGGSRLWWKRFVEKVSFEPGMKRMGVIIPILKDKRGDLTSLGNYRPITLSPVSLYQKYSNLFCLSNMVIICILLTDSLVSRKA